MLDIDYIRENKDKVKEAIKVKKVDLDLDKLLELDDKRREFIQELDQLRQRRNEIADQIPKAEEKEKKKLIEEGKDLKEKINTLEDKEKPVLEKYEMYMSLVPNVPSDDTPVGAEEDYEVIDEWGEKVEFDFKVRDHTELGQMLDVLDLERGVKVSGFRGYFLKNEGALLQFGLLSYAFQKMAEKGFVPMVTPTMVREFALYGSGHFPGERQEIYKLEEEMSDKEKEDKYLVGTAEPSLLAYYADETLNHADLPVKLCGVSPCYRREVGSYGKDTKGVYRIHEFMKVEQVALVKNDIESSEKIFTEMNENARELLRELELPHRVIQIPTEDMGPGKYKMYDIETWMPARGSYGETHSNSNLTDWQSRRLNIKYNNTEGGRDYVYTLNNTVIASPRILIAILENNQQKDGSVKVPKVLQSYVGKEVIKPKK